MSAKIQPMRVKTCDKIIQNEIPQKNQSYWRKTSRDLAIFYQHHLYWCKLHFSLRLGIVLFPNSVDCLPVCQYIGLGIVCLKSRKTSLYLHNLHHRFCKLVCLLSIRIDCIVFSNISAACRFCDLYACSSDILSFQL